MLLFIVIIIGGLGSTLGCFVGALLVGLLANYTGFLAPKVALFSNIGLMVAILLWRPPGLYPVTIAMIASALLSHDLPRSRWLAAVLVVIVLGLALAPFLFPGAKALGVAAKLLVFILLVASYDLLLGYTGIVSFAHTMFFGIGAYGIAIASTRMGEGWAAVGVGLVCALAVSLRAVAGDRPVQPAREGDLLRDDHAGGGHRLPDPGLAAAASSPAARTA